MSVCVCVRAGVARSGQMKGKGSCQSQRSPSHFTGPVQETNTPIERQMLRHQMPIRENRQKLNTRAGLTANFDVAVLPGHVWVRGEAPGSVAPIGISTIVIVQALAGMPNVKHAIGQPQCIERK